MKRSMILSVILLASCAGAPTPPKGHLSGINAKSGYMLKFDFEKDFDSNGKLKSDAKGVRVPITLDSLHRGWFMDAASKEELQAYALKWKQRYQDKCK